MVLRTQAECTALRETYLAALRSGHILPAAAACEGAVETATEQPDGFYRWFTSELYIVEHNIFGEKQHTQPVFETVMRPTAEYLHGHWQTIIAPFISFPGLAESFTSRMATLRRCAAMRTLNGSPVYPHYIAALAAKTPEEYLTQVSQTWSTGPSRADDCIAILHTHAALFVDPSS